MADIKKENPNKTLTEAPNPKDLTTNPPAPVVDINNKAGAEKASLAAAEERGRELDEKFGGGRGKERKETLERMDKIKKFLAKSLERTRESKSDLEDFAAALDEGRADLPNKLLLTPDEFNDFMNDLVAIKDGLEPSTQVQETLLPYIVEKIRKDSIQ